MCVGNVEAMQIAAPTFSQGIVTGVEDLRCPHSFFASIVQGMRWQTYQMYYNFEF